MSLLVARKGLGRYTTTHNGRVIKVYFRCHQRSAATLVSSVSLTMKLFSQLCCSVQDWRRNIRSNNIVHTLSFPFNTIQGVSLFIAYKGEQTAWEEQTFQGKFLKTFKKLAKLSKTCNLRVRIKWKSLLLESIMLSKTTIELWFETTCELFK